MKQKFGNKRLLVVFLALITIGLGATAQAATSSYVEQTFVLADFTTVAIEGSAGGQTGVQIATGGNSGTVPNDPYLKVTTNISAPTRTGFYPTTGFSYDFSAGPISQIDFSVDFQVISAFGNGHGYGLYAEQGGNIYNAADAITGSTAVGWQNRSVSGLMPSNFILITGSGNMDFSENAAPITFGLYTRNRGGLNIMIGYDNLSVQVQRQRVTTPVPTLSFFSYVLIILALGFIGISRLGSRVAN